MQKLRKRLMLTSILAGR